MMSLFESKYDEIIHNGLVLSDYLLLSYEFSHLVSLVQARQSQFIRAVISKTDAKQEPTTQELIRHIDVVRKDSRWPRVLAMGNYANTQTAYLLAEQFQTPALSLFLDAALFEANNRYNFGFSFLLGSLRSTLEHHGFSLKLPDFEQHDILYGSASKDIAIRSNLALKMKWMSLPLFHLEDSQDLSRLAIDSPYAIVLHQGKLLWLNQQMHTTIEIEDRPDLLDFLVAQPKNQEIHSSFQEFIVGYPPTQLKAADDLLRYLSPVDQVLYTQMMASEQEFKAQIDLALTRISAIEAQYEAKLKGLGYVLEFEGMGFSENFYHIFVIRDQAMSQEQLLAAMELFEAFFNDLTEYRALRDSAYQRYQQEMNKLMPSLITSVDKTNMMRNQAVYLDELMVSKAKLDQAFPLVAERWREQLYQLMINKLSEIEKTINDKRQKLNQILIRLGEQQAEEILALHEQSLMIDNPEVLGFISFQTRSTNLRYAEARDKVIAELNQLNLKDLLQADYASWCAFEQAFKQSPLRLGPEHLPALQLLLPDEAPEALESMITALNFWTDYEQALAYEFLQAKMTALVPHIEDEMQALALRIKQVDSPEQRADYFALQEKKLGLQQEEIWIAKNWETFVGLSAEDKARKIPVFWAELSELERQRMAKLPLTRPDFSSLLQLSQYPSLICPPSSPKARLAFQGLVDLDRTHTEMGHIHRPYQVYETEALDLRAAATSRFSSS